MQCQANMLPDNGNKRIFIESDDVFLPLVAFSGIRSMGGVDHDIAAELAAHSAVRSLKRIGGAKNIPYFLYGVFTFINKDHTFDLVMFCGFTVRMAARPPA